MEGIALHPRALRRRVHEGEIEGRVVADEQGAGTRLRLHRGTDRLEDAAERLSLRHREAKWMTGIDTRELERGGLDVGARERLHVTSVGLPRAPAPLLVAFDQDRGDLEQRVGVRIEAAGLHVDDDREIAAKTRPDRGGPEPGGRPSPGPPDLARRRGGAREWAGGGHGGERYQTGRREAKCRCAPPPVYCASTGPARPAADEGAAPAGDGPGDRTDGCRSALERRRSAGDRGVDRVAPFAARARRGRACPFHPRDPPRRGPPRRGQPPLLRHHRVPQHHPRIARGAHSRRSGPRAAHPLSRSLERARDGGEGEPALLGARRAHRELRLFRHPLRRGLQPLLARAERCARRRPGVLSGAQRARHLRARLPRKTPLERPPAPLPPGGRRRRPVLLPPPLADAGLLAVPDRVDGSRTDHGHLPGPLHEVTCTTAACRTPRGARSGPSWATARWTSRSRWARSPSPRASGSTT